MDDMQWVLFVEISNTHDCYLLKQCVVSVMRHGRVLVTGKYCELVTYLSHL